MDLLKILYLNNDGSIRETVVSSILNYLLNPREDHGFHDEFVRRLFAAVVSDNDDHGKSDVWTGTTVRYNSNRSTPILAEIRRSRFTYSTVIPNREFLECCYETSLAFQPQVV